MKDPTFERITLGSKHRDESLPPAVLGYTCIHHMERMHRTVGKGCPRLRGGPSSSLSGRRLLGLGMLGALLWAADTRGTEPHRISEGELEPGQVVVEEIELAPAHTVRLVIEQDGIDLVATVRTGGGLTSSEPILLDGPLERWGTESLLIEGPPSGRLAVEIRSSWDGVATGRYRLWVEALDDASPERLAAETAWTRATIAHARARHREKEETDGADEGAATGYEGASVAFAEAAERFADLGMGARAAAATHARAALARRLGRMGEARDLYRQALGLWQQEERVLEESKVWNDLGLALWSLRQLDEADRCFVRSLELQRSLEVRPSLELQRPFTNRSDIVSSEQNRCLVLHARGQLAAASECYQRARDGFAELGEGRLEATTLNNLGYVFYGLGEPAPALANYLQALDMRRTLGDRVGMAQTLNNLAVVHRGIGELQRALDFYDQARQLQHALGERRQEATTLSNLGVLYRHLGELDRARLYFEQALEARRTIEDVAGEASTLGHLGQLRCEHGETREDREAGRSLLGRAVELAAGLGGRRLEARLLGRLGECSARSDATPETLATLERSLEFFAQSKDRRQEATVRRFYAEALLELGRSAEALTLLEQSLDTELASGDTGGALVSRVALAKTHRVLGDLEAARRQASTALDTIEILRRRIAHPTLRSTFLGVQRETYELLAGTLVELGRRQHRSELTLAGFGVSERARARTLLDLREASGVEPLPHVDEKLVARRHELRRRLFLKAERRARAPNQGPSSVGAAALDLEIAEIERQLEQVEAQMQATDPRHAGRTASPPTPTPASLDEIRRLLGPDTVLLEFLLGEERGWLWRIDAEMLSVHDLPGRATLERDVLALYRAWSRPGATTGGASPATDSPATDSSALALSRTLLGSLWEELAHSDAKRLAIAADGPLHLLPFAALPAPDGSAQVWLDRFELVRIASLSALAAERHRRAIQPAPEAPRRALVLADPVFERHDRRVAAQKPTAASDERTARGHLPTERFDRLPFSLDEARAIAALDPEGVDLALGFDARVERLQARDLEDFRFLHIASHGLVELERPELTGLLLSRVDPEGRAVEGWLRLGEIYDLRLRSDLVVLSGCRTAVGRQVRGEGLLSLARGFAHAGARSVAASLWAVQDRATAELMGSLYQHLWRRDMPPGAALRAAQLELRSRRRWSAPFYWAPWTLQGDWQ